MTSGFQVLSGHSKPVFSLKKINKSKRLVGFDAALHLIEHTPSRCVCQLVIISCRKTFKGMECEVTTKKINKLQIVNKKKRNERTGKRFENVNSIPLSPSFSNICFRLEPQQRFHNHCVSFALCVCANVCLFIYIVFILSANSKHRMEERRKEKLKSEPLQRNGKKILTEENQTKPKELFVNKQQSDPEWNISLS